MRRAVDLERRITTLGLQEPRSGPKCDKSLLWETSRARGLILEEGILARQEDQALGRVRAQNGTWDHPASVHQGTHSADNGANRGVYPGGVQGRVYQGRVEQGTVHQGRVEEVARRRCLASR